MTNTALLKLLVPHGEFGSDVTARTWDAVMDRGPIASLSFSGAMLLFWYTLCGWTLVEYGTNGVLFMKNSCQDD